MSYFSGAPAFPFQIFSFASSLPRWIDLIQIIFHIFTQILRSDYSSYCVDKLWKTVERKFFIVNLFSFFTFSFGVFFQVLYIGRANQVDYHFFDCQPELNLDFSNYIHIPKRNVING
jgi:hypothetical protein